VIEFGEERVMWKWLCATGVVSVLAVPSVASAQCQELTKDGVFESATTSSATSNLNEFMNWVRDHRSSTTSSTVGGGISIPVVGSLNGSSEQYAQLESDYAAMNSGSSDARARLETHYRTVSSALAQRFTECLAIKGLHVWLETTGDSYVFKVAAVFNSPGRRQRNTEINEIDLVPNSMSCSGAIGPGTVVDGSTKRMRCTRNSRLAVAITINADSDPIGGGALNLAQIPDPRPTTEPTCDSTAMVSRGATATTERLTDGVVGPNSPGYNSGRPGGSVWVELTKPEWIHHVVMHPFGNGTSGTNNIKGRDASGSEITLIVEPARMGNGSVPLTFYTDPSRSRGIKSVQIDTKPNDPRAWVAWVEVEVFVCR
jgi:hypothetical protein